MFERLRRSLSGKGTGQSEEDWPSIVLLLAEPQLPAADQALAMAREAWGAAGPVDLVGTVGPHNYVIHASHLYFAFHAVPERYAGGTTADQESVTQRWNQHTAWFAVDVPNRRSSKLRAEGQLADAYLSLMHFVRKHWSRNVLAMYFPAEGVTVPNHGDLIQSMRWARQNGIDLGFLKK